MVTGTTYRCGHAKTIHGYCPQCKAERQRIRRGASPSWLDAQRGFILTAINDDLQNGSRSLLRALYREHPYVFEAALRDPKRARQVARP